MVLENIKKGIERDVSMVNPKSIKRMIIDPKARQLKMLQMFGQKWDDEKYIRSMYKIKVGKELNLDAPKTYTEKLQWLKLYDHRPEYTLLQDKYRVREYVAATIGDEYLIPLLGAWEDANDIDFNQLPDHFVLKCNHDCASVIICRDKSSFDIEQAKTKLNKCLGINYYSAGREWAYKDIKRKIIAEKYMQNGKETTLTDYKFFCFSGKAKMVLLASGEAHTNERRLDYFDMEFNPLPIKRGYMKESGRIYEKPEQFDQLIPLAEKLAQDFPFIRVDFYIVNKHPYFGEVALYPGSGFSEFSPCEWEERIGSWISLPQKQT